MHTLVGGGKEGGGEIMLTGSGVIGVEEGGELKIEKTKIGQYKVYTKLRFSFYHADETERADSKCVSDVSPHRGGNKNSHLHFISIS